MSPLEERFPVGTNVTQTGYKESFEVVGYWRGNVTLLHHATETTHKASPNELRAEG